MKNETREIGNKSRFKLRMDLRRTLGGKGHADAAVLIDKDTQALTEFEANLDEVIVLLRQEIDAINKGQLETVSDLFDRKSDLLKKIELKIPIVQPFLEAKFAERPEFKKKISMLKAMVHEDSDLLSRMSLATSTIAREIEKIQDRHSLNGSYEKSGKRVGNATSARMKIDKNI